MTAITLTAETAAGDLRAELRRIEELLDGADTLDVLRARLDDLTAALRRTRGRLSRLTRKAEPAEPKPAAPTPVTPERTPAPGPAQAVKPMLEVPNRPYFSLNRAQLDRLIEQGDQEAIRENTTREGPSETTPIRVVTPPPASRRIPGTCFALAVLAVIAVAVRGAARAVRRLLSALTRRRSARPAFALPRPGDAPPLTALVPSPLDVAASIQARKRRAYKSYQDTVLLWEIGTRAYEGLERAR